MSGYGPLLGLAGRALRPLQRAAADPDALRRLLASAGWTAVPDDAAVSWLRNRLPLAALDRIAELVGLLDENGRLSASETADLAERIATVVGSVVDLGALSADEVAGLPAELAAPELWADLAAVLPTQLLVGALDGNAPLVASLLRLTGVVTGERRSGPGGRGDRAIARWDRLPQALVDPVGAMTQTLAWGAGFRAELFLRELRLLAARLGLHPSLHVASEEVRTAITGEGSGDATTQLESEVILLRGILPAGVAVEAGLLIASAETATGATGLYVGNLVDGTLSAAADLAPGWTLAVEGEAAGTATIGAVLRPGGLQVVGASPSAELALRLSARPGQPWRLIGSAEGSRVELFGLDLALGLTAGGDEPELWLEVALPEDALSVVLDFGAADGFLRSAVGSGLPSLAFSGGLRLGSRSGLTLTDGTGLRVTVPIDRAVGPVYVASLTAEAGSRGDAALLALTVCADATIGPFAALVDGIGIALELSPDPAGKGFAGLDATLAFVPPTRIGLSIDLEGMVTGGGFIDHDPDTGRWSGALAVDALAVGLAAVVVVDTRLAGDPEGWAFFASISATFPSLPLGFGFFLSGVGGIVCLNRTMDVEALAAAMKDGAADAILFPDDPLVDAPLIVSQLDAWFPLAQGCTVFGVAATIDWGAPVAIVTGELGVLLSIPDLDLAVLGSITMALPTPEAALIELHMDTLGTIDPSEGVVSITAALYDSTLLGTVHLSGDMALYASFGRHPYFLLSVGGYHPQFHPPTGLPSSVLNLRRMRAEVRISADVWYALESYIAVTSNSLQFGAQASLEVTARVLSTTYTARGSVGFDVLLVFSPFRFVADFEASVAITAGSGDDELLAVGLSAHLEGPKPWVASGTAGFQFLFVDVHFHVEFGGSSGAQAPPRVLLVDLVVAALGEPRAWRATVPAGGAGTAVSLTADGNDEPDEVWVRPDGGIEVMQGVAPLDRTLDHYGTYAVDGPAAVSLDGAGVGDGLAVEWEAAFDWFPPAQYDDLDRTARLSAPSYEEMVAGVRFAAASATVPGDAALDVVAIEPGYEVAILEPARTRRLGRAPLLVPLADATAGLGLDPTRRAAAGRLVTATTRYDVRPATWVTVDATTGLAIGGGTTHREATLARQSMIRRDPSLRGSVRVAPASAARAGVAR